MQIDLTVRELGLLGAALAKAVEDSTPNDPDPYLKLVRGLLKKVDKALSHVRPTKGGRV